MSQPPPRPAPGRSHCPACGRLVGATGDVCGVLGADGRTRRFAYLWGSPSASAQTAAVT